MNTLQIPCIKLNTLKMLPHHVDSEHNPTGFRTSLLILVVYKCILGVEIEVVVSGGSLTALNAAFCYKGYGNSYSV